MKDHPIIFSTEMVKAILEGRKTQTRRIIKMKDKSLMKDEDLSKHVNGSFDKVMDFTKTFPYWKELKCPYGKIGDTLWVRESWNHPLGERGYMYKVCNDNDWIFIYTDPLLKWKPSIHMPRIAARIILEITNIRVERLWDISKSDAIAEGINPEVTGDDLYENYAKIGYHWIKAKGSYKSLWKKINGEQSWDQNPYVWVIEFKNI